MISCILLLIQLSYSYLPVDEECTCFYNSTDGKPRCNTTCQVQLIEADRLYTCPLEHFQQRLPFWRWIIAEIFCIAKDNRDDVVENYQSSSTVNYDTLPAFAVNESSSTRGVNLLSSNTSFNQTPNKLSYGSSFFIDANSELNNPFTYPSVSFSSSYCGKEKKAEFLVPSSSTCYYENNTDSKKIVDEFITRLNSSFSNVNFVDEVYSSPGNDGDNGNSTDVNNTNNETTNVLGGNHASLLSESITDNKFVSSIEILFSINETSIIGADVTIIQSPLNDLTNFPLSINIDFINIDQYQTEDRISMKSGNFGYAFGQPVIVLQKKSPQEEPFPVPYGISTKNSYTPLLFGVDVISGFQDENLTFLREDFMISKLGQGNPEFENDWINVSVRDSDPNVMVYTLQIYYAYIGNVNNPQNMIISASLFKPYPNKDLKSCQKIIKCNFFKIANNPSHKYLQPNPRVKGIPPDTFYPFSSEDDF